MKYIVIITVIIIYIVSSSAVMKDDGRAGVTGSPGETTCNTSGCHTGNAINAPGGFIQIDAPTLTGWEYIPGQVYPIEVTVARTGNSLFGFGFEALRSTGANGGSLTITNPAQTQIKSAVVGGNIRTNVVHQLNGGASVSQHTFTFNWTAPAAGTGNVTFYAAGNAANGNGSASGDFIYSTSQIVTQSTVGLDDVSGIFNDLKIYPMPASTEITINFYSTINSTVELNLIDVNGKTVQKNNFPVNSGPQQFNLPLNGELRNGIYFLNLMSEKSNVSRKIIVLH